MVPVTTQLFGFEMIGIRYRIRLRGGFETTHFPVGKLASLLGLRPAGSLLAPSPAGVSSFQSPPPFDMEMNEPLAHTYAIE